MKQEIACARRHVLAIVLGLLASFWAPQTAALTAEISAADLVRFLNDYRNGTAHQQSLAADFQQRLANAGVTFTE